jgi:hypothetical protein
MLMPKKVKYRKQQRGRMSRLLGDRLVGKKADPNLAATLDEARHGDTGRFNLPGRDPTAAHGLQAEVAKS